MVRVAILKQCTLDFSNLGKHAAKLLYYPHEKAVRQAIKNDVNDFLWNIVEPHVEFFDAGEDILETCPEKLFERFPGCDPQNFVFGVEQSYSYPKGYVEVFHARPDWQGYEKKSNMNQLASLFSIKHILIEGDAIALSYRWDLHSETKCCVMVDTTKEDILRILRKRYFNPAILVTNDSLTKYYYQDPLHLTKIVFGLDDDSTEVQFSTLNMFHYDLVMVYMQSKLKELNQIATRIHGQHAIYGKVLLMHRVANTVNASLNEREARRLNALSYGSIASRQPSASEIPDAEGLTRYWSGHLMIMNRISNLKPNNCMNCGTHMIKKYTCPVCCRFKYCESCYDKCKFSHDCHQKTSPDTDTLTQIFSKKSPSQQDF
jgi:hypothetical protein